MGFARSGEIARLAGLLLALTLSQLAAADADLPSISPKPVQPVPYAVELTKGGAVKVTLKGESRVITSEFSLIPGWAKLEGDAATGFDGATVKGDSLEAETKSFSLGRKVAKHDECFEVADTLTNKTGENLPVIVRHQVSISDSAAFFLSGRKIYLKRGMSADIQNPTTVVLTQDGSLGLLAMDDVFRAHILNFAVGGSFGLADQNLVVKPKSSITLRFAVFPSGEKSYFDQVNAMRRYLNVNFRIDGSMALSCGARPAGAKNAAGVPFLTVASSVQEWRDWLNDKSALFANIGRDVELNGPDWLKVADAEKSKSYIRLLKAAKPDLKISMYFGYNFYVLPDGKTRYAGLEVLNADGSQANYRDVTLPLWLAVDGNAYANDLEKVVDFQTQTIPCDGLYWDEFSGSAADWHYGQPWDGVTADIDPQSHQITRLKSSILLLTLPWREKIVRRVLDRKQYVVTNSTPVTETMCKLHILSFTETGSLGNCSKVQLYTPIALGDHLTERTELDCYRWMLQCLGYGCVYYWYHDQVLPITHPTLTSYMFPITPVELGEGYILGKERIVTARSAWFSFGDNAAAEAHFFNAEGIETPRDLPSEKRDGKTWYRVELKEFESCALVKKGAE